MSETKLYFRGVPTDPEIRLLMTTYGVPDDGTMITYEELEKLLANSRDSVRFRTVVSRWRSQLLNNHNVLLIAVRTEGFKVAAAEERVLFGEAKVRSGARATRKGCRVIKFTDLGALSGKARERAEHALRVATAMEQAALTEARRYKGPAALAPTIPVAAKRDVEPVAMDMV